jgi:peptide-methionine (S)-S-oxide reductase
MIFYRDASQKKQAEDYIAKLTQIHSFKAPIITEVASLSKFWRAEDYHIQYYRKHPDQGYIASVTRPEVEKFRKDFPDLVKQ